ncbi:MAG: hypothetical protein DRI71_07675 [Bacteroidetes bacterium]|nr:MAG: hypothetical protein DRI71_07675 [Bacteroidota bacterium]
MKTIKLAILSLALTVSTNSFAQFEDFLLGGAEDANVLFGHYMTPFLKGMGYGFNNGWYNTAKPHESFGFDITLSFNAAIVPEVDQAFEFVASEYNFTRIQSGPTTLPTLMGNNSTSVLENYINQQDLDPNLPPGEVVVGNYGAPDGIADDLKGYGINQVAVPSPIVQVGLGLFKGTEIKVRWLPTITSDDFNYKYFGIGGMHSISQWLPVLKDMDFLDISAFVGYTKISAGYNIPAGNIAGVNQSAIFEVNTLTYQILASAHISVITGYIGLGMDNFTTTFQMLGTYDIYPNEPLVPALVDPIDLRAEGHGSFRTTLGARLKLAILTLHFDYTIREYNTMTAGLGFSFR